MWYVARIIAAQNRRRGRPLTEEEVKDLVQDTLGLIWRKLESYSGRAALESWVYPFCTYSMANAVRAKRRRRDALRVDGGAELGELSSPAPPDPHAYEHLHMGLNQIDPEQAAVIRLKTFDGLSFPEISEQLSLAIGTAKTWYYRGLRSLREILLRADEEGGS